MPERITDRATWARFVRSSDPLSDTEIEVRVADDGDGDQTVILTRHVAGQAPVDLTAVGLLDLIEWSTAGH